MMAVYRFCQQARKTSATNHTGSLWQALRDLNGWSVVQATGSCGCFINANLCKLQPSNSVGFSSARQTSTQPPSDTTSELYDRNSMRRYGKLEEEISEIENHAFRTQGPVCQGTRSPEVQGVEHIRPDNRFGNYRYFTKNAILRKNILQAQTDYFQYTDNNYMDMQSAKSEYLLTDDDLAKIRKITRASPYSRSSFIEVAWDKDLKRLAMDRWGSMQALEREKTFRKYKESVSPKKVNVVQSLKEAFGKDSGAVVMLALSMNVINASAKGMIWMWTRSPSMFSEFMHSSGDVLNQLFLAVGRYKSLQKPDEEHPYGYRNYVHIFSLYSGSAIFCFGFGVTLYHALYCLANPVPLVTEGLFMTYLTLSFNLVTDAVSLAFAVNHIHKDAKAANMSFKQYIKENDDPASNVVLLEDAAGVMGVIICFTAIVLSRHFENPVVDAVGSLTISGMLGVVSFFLMKQNIDKLLGQTLPYEREIQRILENDKFVNAVHDVKSLDMGDQSRFKAEVVLDAKLITNDFLQTKLDEQEMLVNLKSLRTVDELDVFHQEFGCFLYEQIVYHVDRLEKEIKKKFPEVRHIDIEPS
ncbi:zinc transporter 9-like [Mya arenaria]|uniref:zinc transporter 9-like n=1 Tax=Mya arenaria TaxID=6604 RepID=UPI0022DFEE5E|nr:zinc transporter 9-like [Mya arenaria]